MVGDNIVCAILVSFGRLRFRIFCFAYIFRFLFVLMEDRCCLFVPPLFRYQRDLALACGGVVFVDIVEADLADVVGEGGEWELFAVDADIF